MIPDEVLKDLFGESKIGRARRIRAIKEKEKNRLFLDSIKSKGSKYQFHKRYFKNDEIYHVYILLNYDEIVYIGKSVNYEARITAHKFEFNLIRTIKTTKELADKWEKKLIERYQPCENTVGIPYYKTLLIQRKGLSYTQYLERIRKTPQRKAKLNLTFKETKIDNRKPFFSFEEFAKKYRAKFWTMKGKAIYFYTFTPHKYLSGRKENIRIYPISKKPMDLINETA